MNRPRSPRARSRTVMLALAAAMAASVPACSGSDGGGGKGRPGKGRGKGPAASGGARPQGEPMQVNVVYPAPADIERWYRSSGTLEAIRSAELVATQAAVITKVLVDEGDIVKDGQLLARLDGRALSLQADAARISLENLEAELKRLESVRSDAISSEEIDKQRYLVEEARASLKLSSHQAKQTVVRAPFGGTIVTRYVDAGNLATTATPLFHLADLEVLELPLYVPEKDAATVSIGTNVEVELVDGTQFVAKVERRSPVVDAMTGTVKFTMRTATADESTPKSAVPGAFARARVLLDRREGALSLPLSAVFQVDGRSQVFVVAEGKAERREVKLGLEGSERVEVLAGVKAADAVIAEGNSGITEGMPITPVEPAKAKDDADADAEVAATEADAAKSAVGS